jgi:hypothetical protein
MRGRDSVLSFPTMAVRIYLSITLTLQRRDSGLYMMARRWSTKSHRAKKALKQLMFVPANPKYTTYQDRDNLRLRKIAGPFLIGYQTVSDINDIKKIRDIIY